MLNDVKRRNDTMSQAYSTLYVEYIQLKAWQDMEQQVQQPTTSYNSDGGDLVIDQIIQNITLANSKRLCMDMFLSLGFVSTADSLFWDIQFYKS
jgi:tartrate dehydratase alpha subunit/fumarate hydratase class I-like protein